MVMTNLNHNYISSIQINESNKFFEKYYFLNLNRIFFCVLESPNSWIPNLLTNLYFGGGGGGGGGGFP